MRTAFVSYSCCAHAGPLPELHLNAHSSRACNDEHCPDLDPQYESNPPYNRLLYVPSIWLLNGGARLKNDVSWAQGMMRRDDLERGTIEPYCHSEFGIIFTTTVGREDVEQRLFDGVIGLPKGEFDIIEMSDIHT